MRKAIQLICILLIVAAMALPASAASFTPSVEQKGAPVVKDADVYVLPLVDAENADGEVGEALTEAYKSIDDAKSLEEAAPAIVEALKDTDVKVSDLVVRDLFYFGVTKPLAEGETKTVTMEVEGLKKTDFLMVMLFIDGEWVIVDADKVEITKDGEVKITFEHVGPVALVTKIP